MNDFLTLKGGEVDVGGAPEVISVLPFGHVVSQKGEFDVDEESLAAMKEQIAQRGVCLLYTSCGPGQAEGQIGIFDYLEDPGDEYEDEGPCNS